MKAPGENLGPQKTPTFFLMKGQTPAHWEPGQGGRKTSKPNTDQKKLEAFGDSIIQTLLSWQEINILEESRAF